MTAAHAEAARICWLWNERDDHQHHSHRRMHTFTTERLVGTPPRSLAHAAAYPEIVALTSLSPQTIGAAWPAPRTTPNATTSGSRSAAASASPTGPATATTQCRDGSGNSANYRSAPAIEWS
ncbi:hypothetical protein DMH04_00200 [Kibdelosporangium aridum]|uniref:Uncharacterized protein n=1 Tax=Kibdelosporangium aridum TaxID=2030 RepID=A0A428ZTU8_KIBAR|nr:hypothetical protein DMH04_00200 [Kibdelosporangium aridum]